MVEALNRPREAQHEDNSTMTKEMYLPEENNLFL
jgi:hypothetical protein